MTRSKKEERRLRRQAEKKEDPPKIIIWGGLFFFAFPLAGVPSVLFSYNPFPSDRNRGSGCIRNTPRYSADFSAGGMDQPDDVCG